MQPNLSQNNSSNVEHSSARKQVAEINISLAAISADCLFTSFESITSSKFKIYLFLLKKPLRSDGKLCRSDDETPRRKLNAQFIA